MNEDRVTRVTGAQAERLRADVLSLPAVPFGTHLSDDEAVRYALGLLTDTEVEPLDQHLVACTECTAALERLLETSETWRGDAGLQRLADAREDLRTAFTLARTLLWLQVVEVIVCAAVQLTRTRRHGRQFQADTLFQHWISHDITCVLSEDTQGFLFSVDSTNPQHGDMLLRFVLADLTTDDETVAGLLVLYADPLNDGHYIAAARLDEQVILPEHCQPRLALVTLEASQPLHEATVLAAVAAAYEATDRQAWHVWAQREAGAGRLSQATAEAIWRMTTEST